MAREVIAYTYCDVCLANDERTEGEEFQITIAPLKPRVMAVCEMHRKELIDPLKEFLSDLPTVEAVTSTPALGTRRQTEQVGEFPCPACGRVYTYRKSLDSHCRSVHGESLARLRDAKVERDELFDLAESEQPAEEPVVEVFTSDSDTVACDECGKTFTGPRRAQARGSHMSRAHGIAGQAQRTLERRNKEQPA